MNYLDYDVIRFLLCSKYEMQMQQNNQHTTNRDNKVLFQELGLLFHVHSKHSGVFY